MDKQIIIGRTIKDNPTNISYVIVDLLTDGFKCKPKTSAKNIQSEKYMFEEIRNLFIDSTIDIEGFEHNEADNRLVELIIENYIKDSLLNEYKTTMADNVTAKTSTEASLKDMELLMKQREDTINEQEETIHNQSNELAELRLIKVDYDRLKPELSNIKSEMDTVKSELEALKSELETTKTNLQNVTTNLEAEKAERSKDKEAWDKEKLEYETTIQGMEIANSN